MQRDKIEFYSLAVNHLGIDQSSFSNWKIKKIYPNCETLLSMSKHFKCSIDYLLGRTDYEDSYSENKDFDIDFN